MVSKLSKFYKSTTEHNAQTESTGTRVGQKFTLKCGVEVTITEYTNSMNCIVEDATGASKKSTYTLLVNGSLGWFGFAHGVKIPNIGDEYTLKCGVVVSVTAFNNAKDVIVKDRQGNSKSTRLANLRSGCVHWKWNLKQEYKERIGRVFTLKCGTVVTVKRHPNTSRVVVENNETGDTAVVRWHRLLAGSILWTGLPPSVSVGDVYKLKCGVSVTVVKYTDTSNVVVVDEIGNTKTTRGRMLKEGSTSWDEFLKKDIIGQEFTLKCGTVISITEYETSNKIQVSDRKGNSKFVSLINLQRGQVSWKDILLPHWNYLNVNTEAYYVYLVRYKGSIIYIGKGKGNRYLHPTSGQSNNKELNRLYFSGETVEVSIHKEGITNEEAATIEAEMIKLHQPRFNSVGIVNDSPKWVDNIKAVWHY